MADASAPPPPPEPPAPGASAGFQPARSRRQKRDDRARERGYGRYAKTEEQSGAAAAPAARGGASRRGNSRGRGTARPPSQQRAPPQATHPVFTPGSFPVLFAAGPGHATMRESFTPDLQNFCRHLDCFLEVYSRAPQWTAYAAELATSLGFAPGALEMRRFAAAFKGASLVALTQHLAYAQHNAEANVPAIPGLAAASIFVPRALSAVISQYGSFKNDFLGVKFNAADIGSCMLSCIRMANAIVPAFGDAVPVAEELEHAIERWWIPTSASCVTFRFVIACRLQRLAERLHRGCPPVELIQRDLFPPVARAVMPDWYDALRHSIVDQGRVADLDAFVMLPAPTTAAAVANLFSGAVGARRLEALELTWNNPAAEHCAWGFNASATLTRVNRAWTEFLTVTRRFMHCIDVRDLRTTATGSPLQFSVVETLADGTTSVLRSMVGANGPVSSMAMAFPPSCLHDIRRAFCVVNSTTSAIEDTVARWITADVATNPMVAAQF